MNIAVFITTEYLFSLNVVSASIYTFPSFAQPVLDAGKESSCTGRQSGRFSKMLSLLDKHNSAAFFCLCLNAVSLVERADGRNCCASTELSGTSLLQPTMLHCKAGDFFRSGLTWDRGLGKGVKGLPRQALA